MRRARPTNLVARPGPSAWVGIALALLLVLAQAFLLQHQSDHLGTGVEGECPLCVGGHALDHAEAPSAAVPVAAGALTLPVRPITLPQRADATRQANARAPPVSPAA